MWREIYLYPVKNITSIENKDKFKGLMYKEFHSGSVSGNQNYNGLTALGSIASNTPPSAINQYNRIPDGQYTLSGMPSMGFVDQDDVPNVGYTKYGRMIYEYKDGKLANQFNHEYWVKDIIEY